MHEIDRSFRAKRVEAEERRARRLRQRVLGAALGTAGLGLGGVGLLTWPYWAPRPEVPTTKIEAPAEQKPVFVNPIIDLAGDPLIIRLGDTSEANSKLREVQVTPELKQAALPDSVEVMSDVMLSSSERIMALPSSPEDFAFFQSQSARGKPAVSIAPAAPAQQSPAPPQPAGNAEPSDPDADEVLVPVAGQDDLEGGTDQPVEEEPPPAEDGIPMNQLTPAQPSTGEIGNPDADLGAGWSGTVTQGPEALPSFKKTAIDDITTVHLVKPEPDRFRQVEDFTVSVKGERSLESVVADYGFSAEDARNAGAAAKRLIGIETLGDRFIVGLRGYRPSGKGTRPQLVQASINSPDRYLGTIALGDDGTFVAGADPWINDDLSQYAQSQETTTQPQSYRLLDAIYSTATRNRVPSSVTGEAIMLVSRAFDLKARATKDDRLVLVFAKSGRGGGGVTGRVLYVAIHGVDRDFECFVYQPQPGADFACMSEKDATHSVTVTNGMVTPVQGVLTSTFGPRMHPILHQVRIHKGVDWGAPVGTPIMAAFDGRITFAGDGQGYGNVVKIDHGGGKATAYAHMSRFADGIKVGVEVKAGDVIGYVGTSGLSTGPHLHFELYQSGVAVDPLGSAVAGASIGSADSAVAAGSNGSAVELMVNRIIHVESGGNARAKNPLSTAAGLGQFIKSTWLRMIRTYRPELFQSMSEAEILALRYDPTISREMVANLARENEARLRAYGHSITAGRLYLAHFLGPEGAHQALAAAGSALVSEVLGAQVISANPFLTGKDCAYVVAWAERKMTGKAVQYVSQPGLTTKTLVQTSPEFVAYRQAMLQLVAMDTTQGATMPEATPAAATQVGAPAGAQPADEGLQGGDE